MSETRVGGQLWSTYWSHDGKHQSGANFSTEEEREQDALRMLRRGWKVAFGDHADLQEKMIKRVADYEKSQAQRVKRVDEIINLLGKPVLPGHPSGEGTLRNASHTIRSIPRDDRLPVDRPAALNDPLWPDYWRWFAQQEPRLYSDMGEPRQVGSMNLARQEDFNCWKDHRQGILDAWNAWKHSHNYAGQFSLAIDRGKFIETLPERDQEFLQELPGLLDV